MIRRRSPRQMACWCRTQARVHREAAACIRVTDVGSDRAVPLPVRQRDEWLDAATRWETRADLLACAARRPHDRIQRIVELLRVESLRGGHEADEVALLLDQLRVEP